MRHKIATWLRYWAELLSPLSDPTLSLKQDLQTKDLELQHGIAIIEELRKALDVYRDQETNPLIPRALELVRKINTQELAGSIKHLLVMKQLERETGASRLDINEAIETAVRAIRKV